LNDEPIASTSRGSLMMQALVCRYDHPRTDRTMMGREIDRRLDEGS
jgi:hypothetical protein